MIKHCWQSNVGVEQAMILGIPFAIVEYSWNHRFVDRHLHELTFSFEGGGLEGGETRYSFQAAARLAAVFEKTVDNTVDKTGSVLTQTKCPCISDAGCFM